MAYPYEPQGQLLGRVNRVAARAGPWGADREFFATLKREWGYRHRFATRAEARTTIFRYIEVWYNRK